MSMSTSANRYAYRHDTNYFSLPKWL